MRLSNIVQKIITWNQGTVSYTVVENPGASHWICYFNGLFHGYKSWKKQIINPYFKKNYHQLFFDYPGFGNSSLEGDVPLTFRILITLFQEILLKEKIEHYTLVGFSIGGMLAIYQASLNYCRKPELVVLMNTAISINIHAHKLIQGTLRNLESSSDLRNIFSLVYPWFFSGAYLEKLTDLESEVLDEYAAYNHNQKGVCAFIQTIFHRPHLQDSVKKIQVPTLVISSAQDQIFPPEYQTEIEKKLVYSERVHLNCGHTSYIEKSGEVNLAVRNFLTRYLIHH